MLGTRALNRALLARQHLLARADGAPLDLLEHLVGLQAQEPQEPYVGVWSRLRDFVPADLSELLARREAVRVLLMRRHEIVPSSLMSRAPARRSSGPRWSGRSPTCTTATRGNARPHAPGCDRHRAGRAPGLLPRVGRGRRWARDLGAAGRVLGLHRGPSALTAVAPGRGGRWPQ